MSGLPERASRLAILADGCQRFTDRTAKELHGAEIPMTVLGYKAWMRNGFAFLSPVYDWSVLLPGEKA